MEWKSRDLENIENFLDYLTRFVKDYLNDLKEKGELKKDNIDIPPLMFIVRTSSGFLQSPATNDRTSSGFLQSPATNDRTSSGFLQSPATDNRTSSGFLQSPATDNRTSSGDNRTATFEVLLVPFEDKKELKKALNNVTLYKPKMVALVLEGYSNQYNANTGEFIGKKEIVQIQVYDKNDKIMRMIDKFNMDNFIDGKDFDGPITINDVDRIFNFDG